jgi:hypothetical protein
MCALAVVPKAASLLGYGVYHEELCEPSVAESIRHILCSFLDVSLGPITSTNLLAPYPEGLKIGAHGCISFVEWTKYILDHRQSLAAMLRI